MRIKSAVSLVTIAILFSYGLYSWLNLPYRRFPLNNSLPRGSPISGPGVLRPTYADLAYADQSPFEKLDLYLPKQPSAAVPLVIWIHGGGLQEGDKRAMPRHDSKLPNGANDPRMPYQIQVPDVAALTEKGYAVASLNYRLGWKMLTDAKAAIQDCKAAVRFLRANAGIYGVAPDKFAVWGNSAGGYVAAMLGVTGDQSTKFDNAALGYPSVSSEVQAVVVWFGAEDRLPDEELSIAHYIPTAKTLPPFKIANGDADPIISTEQAQRLQDALAKAGAKSSLTILHGAGHEDPLYTKTQMIPTFEFLDKLFLR